MRTLVEKRFGPSSSAEQATEIRPVFDADYDYSKTFWRYDSVCGNGSPFLWIHSGTPVESAFCFFPQLSNRLGPDQSAVAIGNALDYGSGIEEAAKGLVRDVLTIQPIGPYFLGGAWCGGMLAYEVACQLRELGHSVGLLVLVESHSPLGQLIRWKRDTFRVFTENLRYWLKDWICKAPSMIARQIHKVSAHRLWREKWKKGGKNERAPSSNTDGRLRRPVLDTGLFWFRNRKLFRRPPKRFSGRLTLFRARTQPLACFDPALGWGALADKGVAVNIVPGTPNNIFRSPNREILIAELRACLVEAKAENASPNPSIAGSNSGLDTPSVETHLCSLIT